MKHLIIIALFFLFSCSVSKDLQKTKTDRTTKEQVEIITKRVGDTVTYEVPKFIFKDTTIVKKNYVTGTTQVLRYNSQGQIDLAQCISGAVEEITRSNREIIEFIKEKDKQEEAKVSSSVMFYFMLGLAIIVLILAFFFYKLLNKNTQAINAVLNRL